MSCVIRSTCVLRNIILSVTPLLVYATIYGVIFLMEPSEVDADWIEAIRAAGEDPDALIAQNIAAYDEVLENPTQYGRQESRQRASGMLLCRLSSKLCRHVTL